jgi:hypothetical protein
MTKISEKKVFRENKSHCGIVFLWLEDERAAAKIEAIKKLIDGYGERLVDAFVVVTEKQVRFR